MAKNGEEMAANIGMSTCAKAVLVSLTVFGLVCLLVGGVVYGVFPSIYQKKVEEGLTLAEGSESAERFANPPVPTTISYHMFHVTNMDEVNEGTAKPNLTEVGPFVFVQHKTKEALEWDTENRTVTYLERTIYTFDRENSAADLSTEINHVNIPDIVVTHTFNSNGMFQTVIKNLKVPPGVFGNLVVTHSVSEILFEGYRIRFFDWLKETKPELYKMIAAFVGDKIPKDHTFSLFGEKNNTVGNKQNENRYTVSTGMSDYVHIFSYNNRNELPYWQANSHCQAINGTDGSQFPPFQEEAETLYVFSSEICRSLRFEYRNDEKVQDIKVRRFTVPEKVFEDPNGENSENKCFCVKSALFPKAGCPKAGVIPLEPCLGQPVAMSAPHFYMGDEMYWKAFDGLLPDKDKHETFLDVEPTTGTVLRGRKRLQLNVITTFVNLTDTMKHAEDGFFPVLWLEEGAEIDGPKAQEFKDKVINPKKTAEWSLIAVMAIGAVAVLLGLAFYLMKR